MTLTAPELSGIGNLPDDYRHHAKLVEPAAELSLAGSHLKWYDIRPAEAVIPAELQAQAREFLRAETASGHLVLTGELGFVMLHRCGESFYFLLVCTWRNGNELWETVYAKDGDAAFGPVALDSHKPTFCVWELGAVCHEQQAWSRYLYSDREHQARLAYVDDRFAGPV